MYAKNGPTCVVLPDHPIDRLVHVDIGAVARGLDALVVPEEDRIGVPAFATAWIGRLADAAAPVHERIIESLVDRAHGMAVTQVPFPEDAGCIPFCVQHLRKGDLFRFEHRPPTVGVDRRGSLAPASGHQ